MKIAIRRWFQNRFGVVQRPRKRSKSVKQAAACLAVGLASAWGGTAEAARVKVAITPEESLTDIGIVFYFGNTSSTVSIRYLGDAAIGTENIFILDFAQQPEAFENGHVEAYYRFAALYDNAGETSVALAFSDDAPVTAGLEYEQLLGPDRETLIDRLESQNLSSRSQPWFVRFDSPYRDDFPFPDHVTRYGTDETIVNFSQASYGGVINVSVVPEPTSISLFACSAGVFLFPRRRRS